HERQWWAGRENLLARLASRGENKRKLASVLASVGGTEPPHNSVDLDRGEREEEGIDAEAEKELKLYDRKVHKAYGEMVAATRAELKGMGIPFFAIAGERVGKEGEEGKVGEEDLERLRGRMVGFLEDMVRE
ncbi:MAG: hypothetical protein Q9170_007145, partial [Blastenia crenularia]